MKRLERRINECSGTQSNNNHNYPRNSKDYERKERDEKKKKKIYSKMADYLEQIHITARYYERIVNQYKENLKTRCCRKREESNTEKADELGALLNNYISSWKNAVNNYLHLVIPIAKRYQRKMFIGLRKLEIMELIQEGNIGLMRAVEKFDYTRGVKFSSYAWLLIVSEIKHGIDEKSRLIKTSPKFNKLCRDYEKARRECGQKLGKEPAREEVYKRLGINDEQKSFLELRRNLANIVELDKQVRNNNRRTIGETVPNNEQSPLDRLEENELHDEVDSALEQLDEREIYVVSSHFGLYENQRGAKDIGIELGVSRITVHNVQNAALRKMKQILVKDIKHDYSLPI